MPDDLDGWVFDDDFVRGGRHEPPARTRAAISEHGGRQTSWRQPGAPVGAEPQRSRKRRRSSTRAVRWIAALLVIAAAAAGVWVYGSRNDDSQRVPSADHPTTIADTGGVALPSATSGPLHQVNGVSPSTPIGTCLRDTSVRPAAATGAGSIDLSTVACTAPHSYELVAVENAADSASYPSEAYWQGPVASACLQAFVRYTAQPSAARTEIVANRTSTFFRPQPVGWADGDRTVYCVAHSGVALPGSIRRSSR